MTFDVAIRDADLIAELEAARGSAGFEFKRINLTNRQQERDKLARMSMGQRRRHQARRSFEEAPAKQSDLRHIHSVLAICSFPYTRQPIETRSYERAQGRMSLLVTAGALRSPDGRWVEQPLPYGTRARLLMAHLCSEAIRQKSAIIEIEDSLTAFIHAMGFPVTGGVRGTLTAFKQQINALAACHMHLGFDDGRRASTLHAQPFQRIDVWFPTEPAQRLLWPSTITFSTDFYESLRTHALPVNMHAMRLFANSPRKLDMLFWLGYRLNSLSKPLSISWDALQDQFGQGYAEQRFFRAHMSKDVRDLQEAFPKLPILVTERGMVLSPADPTVLAIPARRRG